MPDVAIPPAANVHASRAGAGWDAAAVVSHAADGEELGPEELASLLVAADAGTGRVLDEEVARARGRGDRRLL